MAFYPNHMLNSAYLIGAVNNRPSKEAIRQQYVGLKLLPWQEVPERNMVWDVMESENNLAGVYAPKDRATPGDDLSFGSVFANLVDVKASRMLDPWAVQSLRDPGMPSVYKAGGSAYAVQGIQQRLKDHFNKRLAWCNEVVDSQVEYFAMHALQGQVVWPPVDNDGNDITYPMPHWGDSALSINFPLPANQNQAVTTLTGHASRTGGGYAWSDATNADPLKDLRVIDEYMLKTLGITLKGGRILMSTVTLNKMIECTKILDWIAGSNKEQQGARTFVAEEDLKTFVKTKTGWTIETYDANWTFRTRSPGSNPTITRVDFLKEGKILILPAGEAVGNMATTLVKAEPGPSGKWVYGKFGWSKDEDEPPYGIKIGVEATAWPRFDYYDWFVLDTEN